MERTGGCVRKGLIWECQCTRRGCDFYVPEKFHVGDPCKDANKLKHCSNAEAKEAT